MRRGSRRHYLANREAARALVHARLGYFNQLYQHKVGRVFIRNTRSRWGSCSSKGNLNFNYRLALLPPALADYIIVHELCHLAEFNHSPQFWAQVSRACPGHRTLRKVLRQVQS